MFGLRTSQGCRDEEVGVEENQEKMCNVFVRILSLKNTPYISQVIRVFIVRVKNLVKYFFFLPNGEFHGYLARWPFLLSTREFNSLA